MSETSNLHKTLYKGEYGIFDGEWKSPVCVTPEAQCR